MKKRSLISLFVLIISVFTCCFVFTDKHTTPSAHAASDEIGCYDLIGQDGNSYVANVEVGKVSGLGEFIVGAGPVTLSATANENYQIKGWEITYTEQSDKVEFVDTSSLVSGSKTIELQAKDGSKVSATVTYVLKDNLYVLSTFSLDKVFEHLEITPVFDTVYYKVDVTSLVNVAPEANALAIGEDVLYYDSVTTDGGVKTYTKAYIKMGSKYYYYGDVLEKSGRYYTLHNTISSSPVIEEIDYAIGGYRISDKVSIEMDVDIDVNDIHGSKNMDLIGVSLLGNISTSLTYDDAGTADNSYSLSKDSIFRTTDYSIRFNIIASSNQQNVIDIVYHNLYVVDLVIEIDGNASHSEHDDVFGTTQVNSNEILSNISIYNFHSRTKNNNLQFLAKKASDNNAKSFGLSCASAITKVVDGVNYKYYDFERLDGSYSQTKYYSSLENNIVVVINYAATQHEIQFVCTEYILSAGGQVSLVEMEGAVLETINKRRGESVNLTLESGADVENIGYELVGYANSLTGEVQTSLTYTLDRVKPRGTTIYMCFQKAEYDIVLANYNQVMIDSQYPLSSISFSIINAGSNVSETLNSDRLTGTSITLDSKIKLNGTLTFVDILNSGFEIAGYSFVSPDRINDADYLTEKSFVVDTDFISQYCVAYEVYNDASSWEEEWNQLYLYNNTQRSYTLNSNSTYDPAVTYYTKVNTKTITLYVYETFIEYTLTFEIDATHDSALDEDVIMAEIDAISTGANIERYDINGTLISAENGNLSAMVAKIVVGGLKYKDQVKLISKGLTVGTGDDQYTYSFNWFTEDGKSTLPAVYETDHHSYTEIIQRSRTIKVVYSMPSTKVFITLAEEYAKNPNFVYNFKVEKGGQVLSAIAGTTNSFAVDVGVTITITLANIAFGYDFVGYTHLEESDTVAESSLVFDYITKVGINTLQLNFTRIEYRFIFKQYGVKGVIDGTTITFGAEDYAKLDVDHTTLTIQKPVDDFGDPYGYYVSAVTFAGSFKGYSEDLCETNNDRHGDIANYEFNLTRDMFIVLVSDYGATNAIDGVVEVQVRLDYLMFTYKLQVNYGLTNPKNDSRDSYVIYPAISLNFTFDGLPYTAEKDPTAPINTIIFHNIPYSSVVKLNLLTGAPLGFSLAGWYFVDNTLITDQYSNSSRELVVGELTQDKTEEDAFVYRLTYVTYDLNVVYDSSQGSPEVKINNKTVTGNDKKITIYDKLEISANALRSKGYGFDKYTYQAPTYTPYVYSDETWSLYRESLYVLIDGIYEKNSSSDYDNNKIYYIYNEETKVVNNSSFVVNEINIANFVLGGQDKQIITINIDYKLIELTIKNSFAEFAQDVFWTLLGRGDETGNHHIKFDLAEFANISMTATDKDEKVREITAEDSVNFNDVITIRVAVNKAATNVNGDEYDLTRGLTLKSVTVSGVMVGFTTVSATDAEYEVKFQVGTYFPASGEELSVAYTFEVTGKVVEVTTIVKESATFYGNISMHINAARYGFELSDYFSNGQSSRKRTLQFLAKTNIYAEYLTDDYKNNFAIAGANVYCDGKLIPSFDYASYGIVLNDDMSIDARVMNALKVEFIVQPKITFNGGPSFEKSFVCDDNGVGVAQELSLGSTSSDDVQVANLLLSAVTIKYKAQKPGSIIEDSATNVGLYNVFITFENTGSLDWLSQVTIAEDVTLTIQPKSIYLTYNPESIVTVKKVYNKTSDYNVTNIYPYLKFTDNKSFNMNYSEILAAAGNNLRLQSAACYIATSGKDAMVSAAVQDKNTYYNLYVYDFALKDTEFNANFALQNEDLIIYNYIQITKREITLQNISVQSKVEDGTDAAVLKDTDKISITNIISGDLVTIDVSKLKPKFKDALMGENKEVLLDATDALTGADVNNYYVGTITKGASIYPYSLKAEIEGVGKIEVFNRRGLTDASKVDLIPIDASLVVTPIYFESQHYVTIYSRISKYLKGNNEFAIGYKISMLTNGENVPLDRELYLSVPQVQHLTGAYFLTGNQTGKLNVSYEGGNMLIDLNQIGEDFDRLILVKAKFLLKVWQIVLIVVGGLLIVTGGVLTFFIIRKRKIDRDSVHEKI